jgi:hypothetical protein
MDKLHKQENSTFKREDKNGFIKTNQLTQYEKEKQSNDSTSIFEKFELMTTNFLFSIMIILTTIGTFLIIINVDEFLKPLKPLNPNYEFPSFSDFKITLISSPIIIVKKYNN